jgi:hypothetical protein
MMAVPDQWRNSSLPVSIAVTASLGGKGHADRPAEEEGRFGGQPVERMTSEGG